MKPQKSTKSKNLAGKPATATAKSAPAPPAPPARVAPLFRGIDWLALAIAFGVVWVIYFLTLAPEETLQDSGELCTGSFYAGIPHPPGYPFWAIYSWLWTKLLPIGNVAWRVEVGEATAAAMACGLVAFMVSRGSSLLVEGIEELKSLTGKWENAICLICGSIAGLLLGMGGVMWSESVAINRISLFGVPWVMIVMLCLMRWIYAQHQRRYLYASMFFFGICATIHQTLLVAAMGIEITVASVQPKLGRDLFLGNSIVYVLGLIAQANHFITMLDTAPMVLALYHIVGIASILAWIWLGIRTSSLGTEWKAALVMGLLWVAGASFYFYEAIAGMTDPPMQWGYPRTVNGFFHALSRGQYEKANPTDIFNDPGRFVMQLGMLVSDIAHEYNWVCLFVALVPLLFFFKMQKRERSWIIGLTSMYLCIGVLLLILMNPAPDRQSADLNRVFFTSSHALIAIMIGYGLALTVAYMATHYQRFRLPALLLGIVTVVPGLVALYNGVSTTFYGGVGLLSPRHVILLFLCLGAGFVLAALAAQRLVRVTSPTEAAADKERWFFLGFASIAAVCLALAVTLVFFRPDSLTLEQVREALGRVFAPGQYNLPAVAGLLILVIVAAFIAGLLIYRQRAPLVISLGLFAVMPLCSGLSHWAGSEQRNHWFGYWFGHDMFTPPFVAPDGKFSYDSKLREQVMKGPGGNLVYPEMTRDTILFGGTDPGRFCPTYMIFCDSFILDSCKPSFDPTFDRRDVYLITQNALADATYLDYLRAQYFRSQEKDPPFFSELARFLFKDQDYQTNLLARLVSPLDWIFEARGARVEKRWRTYTSWFSSKDFTNLSALAAKLRPGDQQDPLSRWLFQNLGKETQGLITGQGDEHRLRGALAGDLNRLIERELNKNAQGASNVEPLYDPKRFARVKVSDYLQKFIAQNPQSDTRIRLNRLLLEAAYPDEIARSRGGVYPDREIYIPNPEDSQRCFQEYLADTQTRVMHDQQFPNEPKQVKPGEDVKVVDNRLQVSGQIAVMSINGLLTKVIFDHNPGNDFYIEESFPLDWMYPYLTPYGIIMKINRQPLAEITDELVKRDHEFWSNYSERLIGNWITYDTPVQKITDFVEKVYLRRNYKDFSGDRRFLRDEEAQKAFSKLRSSIGGIYAWRISDPNNQNSVVRNRMIKEADFAFRQAFAFCPYSPEAVFRYVNLLANLNRLNDALLIARTCRKLDPYNSQVIDLVNRLEESQKQSGGFFQIQNQIARLEEQVRLEPGNYQKAFELASGYIQLQQNNRAIEILERVLADPHVQPQAVLAVAQAYASMSNETKLDAALERLVQVASNEPESWYDLAASKSALGRSNESRNALRRALELNVKRLANDPKAKDLRSNAIADPHFAGFRQSPEFKALLAPP